jgi:signal transduction histidine kinase
MVTNLLANAIKYGAGNPIDVAVDTDGRSARLLVRDRGIGIEHEEQLRIFGRFERAASARRYGGFGLGLWIVHRIVELTGGTIVVESDPGQGATFVIKLPLARSRA